MNADQEKMEAAMGEAVDAIIAFAGTMVPAGSEGRDEVIVGNAASVLTQAVVTSMLERGHDRDAIFSGLSLGLAYIMSDNRVENICAFYAHAHNVAHMVEAGALEDGEVRVSRGVNAPPQGNA